MDSSRKSRDPSAASGELAILEHIRQLPHSRTSLKHLARELGAKGEAREQLEEALAHLVDRGALIEFRTGHYVAANQSREFAAGRLQMHRDGYGFLIPDQKIEGLVGDVYIPAGSASQAMHGDRVLVRIGRIDRDGRAEGEILKVLRRAHVTVVGEFRVRPRGNFVVPHDERIRERIEIPEGLEIPPSSGTPDRIGAAPVEVTGPEDLDGLIVNVEVLEYPENGERGVGRVIEILGHPDDFGVDVEIIIRKHHLPHHFPSEVLEEAQSCSPTIRAEEAARRDDFRGMDVVTIDGETARDFDDAVWVDLLENGNYALHVHIADVSHYVQPGSAIDVEARLRGTSVYFPDRAIPMLPLELSTNLCSLNPGVDRLTLSVLLEIDHSGDVVKKEFTRGIIRSVERMTYTNVHLLLEGDAGQRERYQALLPRFERMRELAQILTRKRQKRGSIDFDLPEPVIEFDESGGMTGVSRAPRNIAHRLIEEFMLAANEAVASHLEDSGIPSIYRIHESPNPQRVLEFEEIAAHFGHSLGVGTIPARKFRMVDRKTDGRKVGRDIHVLDQTMEISSRHYQKLVARIEGKPEERILSYLMLRSLKQARYSAENSGHFALAAPSYTHFTSPIRRYPDLIVHRVLSMTLDRRTPGARGPKFPFGADGATKSKRHDHRQIAQRALQSGPADPETLELAAIAEECSQTERRSADAERELVEWKKIKFMIEKVGEEFDALIISTTRFGFFVELEELFVEGLVPIDTLPGERFHYHENVRKIIGERTRREFSIGDKVRVLLDRVDGVEKKLQFSIVQPPAKKPGRKSRRSV